MVYRTIQALDSYLQSNNKSVQDYGSLPQLSDFEDLAHHDAIDNRLLAMELSLDTARLTELRNQARLLNEDQRAVYDKVIEAVADAAAAENLFFLDGPGGTGKSFLLQTILATVRSTGKVALAVASSGVASSLLMGGRTAHYTFQLGLDLNASSCCNISANSARGELLRKTDLIAWDEASLMVNYGFQAVNLTLQDLMKNDKPFGGKVVLLAGDFRQCLPVIPHGSPEEVIDSCVKRSSLWSGLKVLRLRTNMRVKNMTNQAIAAEAQAFADFLLHVGDGRNGGCAECGGNYTRVQHDMVLTTTSPVTQQDQALINHVYGDMSERLNDPDYFSNRAILTQLNEDVHKINNAAIEAIPGEYQDYESIDAVEGCQENESSLFPVEFLNALTISGMPPHKLRLKVGAPIILLSNISGGNGLCIGTRLQVLHLQRHCIEAKVLTCILTGKVVVIPRIPLVSHGSGLPFELRRRQFPVQLAFALTINKAQGQTLRELGVYLPQPVFFHGQLYVALSRATSRRHIRIALDYSTHQVEGGYCLLNVVYRSIVA